MTVQLEDPSAPALAYICLGGFVVVFSMISLLVKEKLYINEVVLGTGFGVIIGPYVANVFDPRSWGDTQENMITLEVMRIVLVIGLFAAGVELPPAYMKKHTKGLLVMVVPTMALGWVIVSAALHALFPRLDLVSALCIAACLTPTDPVTCAAITRGKFATMHVPVEIRRILSAEAAANDGLAYPFLNLAIYLTIETSTRVAIGKWFLISWLYEVILGTILGAVVGLLFSKLMTLSHRKGFIDRESYIAQYLALSIFIMGVAKTIGVDDLLAAFAAGCAISWDGHFSSQTEDDSFSSVIDYILNCGCFIYIGAWLPFESYNSSELALTPWRLVVLTTVILVLRRVPPLLVLYRWVPEIASWKEALFCGHFGPMGVSAIFVSAFARTRLPGPMGPPENQAQLLATVIQPIVSFVVLGSIIAHGLSIPVFNLGREFQSRTTTITSIWTRTKIRPGHPDWLEACRPELGTDRPNAATIGVDIECGTQIDAKADTTIEVGSDETGNHPSKDVITVEEVAAVIISREASILEVRGSDEDEVTEHTEVAEENLDNTEANEIELHFKQVKLPFVE